MGWIDRSWQLCRVNWGLDWSIDLRLFMSGQPSRTVLSSVASGIVASVIAGVVSCVVTGVVRRIVRGVDPCLSWWRWYRIEDPWSDVWLRSVWCSRLTEGFKGRVDVLHDNIHLHLVRK